jgi:membrane fusion protein (multidrug efflux system)
VAERLVSVGDYVTRGTKVATVMRVNPLRLELTVPAQFISAVAVGRQVTLEVDSYPGQSFTGQVRYVSPGVRADSRALVVEAVVPNASGLLKPGLFVTARIEQGKPTPGVLVPSAAVVTTTGTSRVFVVVDTHVEERIVTIGQQVGDRVEATSGVTPTDVVAVTNLAKLSDGTEIAK